MLGVANISTPPCGHTSLHMTLPSHQNHVHSVFSMSVISYVPVSCFLLLPSTSPVPTIFIMPCMKRKSTAHFTLGVLIIPYDWGAGHLPCKGLHITLAQSCFLSTCVHLNESHPHPKNEKEPTSTTMTTIPVLPPSTTAICPNGEGLSGHCHVKGTCT